MSHHRHGDPNTNATAPLAGLVRVASLTNQEVFTAVIAAIKRSVKHEKKNQAGWQSAAMQVATAAARGERDCSCDSDWVRMFHDLSSSDQEFSGVGSATFGGALRALPAHECYRKRLDNALTSSWTCDNISIRQVVGLIRGSTLLTSDCEQNSDAQARKRDCALQARALACLVRVIPQMSFDPCNIFLAVQLPILQRLRWETFIESGIKFPSSEVEATFRSFLDLEFGGATCVKRRRMSEGENSGSCQRTSPSTISHLLEAAHLARNGIVRAKHGAVIYISEEGSTTKVIGRGWNHDFLLDRSKSNKNKIVLHSECHAVVDALRNHGEDACFTVLFPQATIMIVELESDNAYETCHPCPKCDPLLRAVGILSVLHTTPFGKIQKLELSPAKVDLLSNENVATPLRAACDEQKFHCKRLQDVCFSTKKGPIALENRVVTR